MAIIHPRRMKRRSVRFAQAPDTVFSPNEYHDCHLNIDGNDSDGKSNLYYSKIEFYDILKNAKDLWQISMKRRRIESSNHKTGNTIIGSVPIGSSHKRQCEVQLYQVRKCQSLIQPPTLFALCSETRGLENIFCKEWRRRRYLTNKIMLCAASHFLQKTKCDHHDDDGTTRLASIAKRCTASATTIATDEGFRDFCRAYDIPMNDILSLSLSSSSLLKENASV